MAKQKSKWRYGVRRKTIGQVTVEVAYHDESILRRWYRSVYRNGEKIHGTVWAQNGALATEYQCHKTGVKHGRLVEYDQTPMNRVAGIHRFENGKPRALTREDVEFAADYRWGNVL